MAESLAFRLGRWFGNLPLLGKVGAVIGVLVAIGIVVSSLTSGGNTANPSTSSGDINTPPASASCASLGQTEINTAVDGWTGDGTLTVEAARKVPSGGSDIFTEVWFIQGSAPGIDSEVFIFANDPGGLLVGANSVTREFFSWGAAAALGSPLDVAARDTMRAAPTCLS